MSTAFRDALDELANLSVTGIQHNYAIAALPDSLSRAQLPALLVLPVETQDKRLFRERGTGFLATAFENGARSISYNVTHLLLVTPVETGVGLSRQIPTLVDSIDAYITALAQDVLLGDTLLEPARVQVEVGSFEHGGVAYYGCAFRHLWLVQA